MSSHKGSRHRLGSKEAYDSCPLWNKSKPTRLIDIIKEYPGETLTYEKGFDLESFDLPLETYFKSITELNAEDERRSIAFQRLDHCVGHNENQPRIFKITNNQDQTCKIAVWM